MKDDQSHVKCIENRTFCFVCQDNTDKHNQSSIVVIHTVLNGDEQQI